MRHGVFHVPCWPRALGVLFLGVLFLRVFATAGTAQAHPHSTPAPVNVYVEIAKGIIQSTVTVDEPLFREWIGRQGTGEEPNKDDARSFVKKHAPVKIGDLEVEPTVQQVQVLPALKSIDPTQPDIPERYMVHLRYPLPSDEIPPEIYFGWDRFDGVDWEGSVQVPITLKSPRNIADNLFSPVDPNYTWRASEHKPRPIRDVAHVEAKPPTHWTIPLSLLIGLAALLALGLLPALRQAGGAIRGLVLGCALVATALLWSPLSLSVLAPGSAGSVLPTQEEGKAIFQALLDNVYAAFDVDDEDAIYDRLMLSIDGALINDVYAEVYESRIMREKSGVIIVIEHVDHEGGTVTLPAQSWQRHFTVVWKWKVHGAITHLNHTHRRTNIYHAEFNVRHTGDAWKIAEQEIYSHRREDTDVYPEGQSPDDLKPEDAERFRTPSFAEPPK